MSYLPLRVVRIEDNGKRTFDAENKRRLIEACRQPGDRSLGWRSRLASTRTSCTNGFTGADVGDGTGPRQLKTSPAVANSCTRGAGAHARRYLIEAEEALPKATRAEHPVAGFIERIGMLFVIEAQTKDVAAQQRQQVRAEQSRPVLSELETLLLHTVLPQSLFGQALHYLHGQWTKLTRYVENGAWPISNNPCENAIRPFVAGRRNWLFCDTVAGANASANLYSLVETAKVNDVDPYR